MKDALLAGAAGAVGDPPMRAPASAPVRAAFDDPEITATGERRARVALGTLRTLWFATGTLCNLSCEGCYIESSPRNDRLAYPTRDEVRGFLDEAARRDPPPDEIGFTGGEPFLNPALPDMIEDAAAAGFRVLVLTNAMRPMQKVKDRLCEIGRRWPGRLTVRVSLDHHAAEKHEALRGRGSWQPTLDGLVWLVENGFDVAVASRTVWGETDAVLRDGFAALFAALGLAIDARDPSRLVLFPELDDAAAVPEITERCWGILGKDPGSVMCATSRMVVKRKGAARPTVVACTLLPYDPRFEVGATLAEAQKPVWLNHRHCARFCVLGGASCSPGA
ncbi:radical SAM protein [Rhodoplanes sp. SY1]|uniref:radical SAM protein n=1 Tax=Rhodoplanes sp. SY1 TaxID=3166646 RepID=UPI0038B67F6B